MATLENKAPSACAGPGGKSGAAQTRIWSMIQSSPLDPTWKVSAMKPSPGFSHPARKPVETESGGRPRSTTSDCPCTVDNPDRQKTAIIPDLMSQLEHTSGQEALMIVGIDGTLS